MIVPPRTARETAEDGFFRSRNTMRLLGLWPVVRRWVKSMDCVNIRATAPFCNCLVRTSRIQRQQRAESSIAVVDDQSRARGSRCLE